MPRKNIGLLAMSIDSTQWYVKQLLGKKNTDGTQNLVYPTNFEAINQLLPWPSVALQELLFSYLPSDGKIDYLLVPNITIHEVLDVLCSSHQLPYSLVHPIVLTIEKLLENKVEEVVIFGSRYTMQQGYVSKKLEQAGITCSFPTTEDVITIDACRRAVYDNTASKELISNFNGIVGKYAKEKPVVLSCTELSMAYSDEIDNVYDMAQLQIEFCLNSQLKYCARCDEQFKCHNQGGCWCNNLKLTGETHQQLLKQYDNCLCEACLTAFAEKTP
jgi:aspartate racemase